MSATKPLLILSLAFFAVGCKKEPTETRGELLRAARSGDVGRVQSCLSSGVDLNARDQSDNTPLLIALLNRHEDLARLLVTHGADVNLSDHDGLTPLLCAFQFPDEEMAKLLITEGAEVNVRSPPRPYAFQPYKVDHMPLHYAAIRGFKHVSELLIAKGADVNARGGITVRRCMKRHEKATRM